VIVQVLEGENAIAKNREVMGATDPRRPPRNDSRDLAPASMKTSFMVRCAGYGLARIGYFFAKLSSAAYALA